MSAEDIRRSGALSLPDVLRMPPGIQAAQIDSEHYSISTRGFSSRFANKLQVMIDGRTLYGPFFSGNAWALDPIPLEGIERIEAIRGPAAIWSANALNGLINIISRHSRSQQEGNVSTTIGTRGQVTQQQVVDTSFYRYCYRDLVSNTWGSLLYPVYRFGHSIAIQNLERCNCGKAWVSRLEPSADWQLPLSYAYTKATMGETNTMAVPAWGQGVQHGAAHHYGSLRSHWQLAADQELDAWLRRSSSLERTPPPYTTSIRVPGYVTLNLRHAYRVHKDVELAVTGRNLLGQKCIEYVTEQAPAPPVPIAPSLLFSAGRKF